MPPIVVELKGPSFAAGDGMNTSETSKGRVVRFIRLRRAAPLLEVSSVSEVSEDELQMVLDDLEQQGLIKVSDDIVVARGKLLRHPSVT